KRQVLDAAWLSPVTNDVKHKALSQIVLIVFEHRRSLPQTKRGKAWSGLRSYREVLDSTSSPLLRRALSNLPPEISEGLPIEPTEERRHDGNRDISHDHQIPPWISPLFRFARDRHAMQHRTSYSNDSVCEVTCKNDIKFDYTI